MITVYYVALIRTGQKIRAFADQQKATTFCAAWNQAHRDELHKAQVITQ